MVFYLAYLFSFPPSSLLFYFHCNDFFFKAALFLYLKYNNKYILINILFHLFKLILCCSISFKINKNNLKNCILEEFKKYRFYFMRFVALVRPLTLIISYSIFHYFPFRLIWSVANKKRDIIWHIISHQPSS